MGLLTAIAALAVAVVASAWRPSDLEVQIELAAGRAVSVFVLAGRVGAALLVTVAILAIPQGFLAIPCLGAAFVATLVSVAVGTREDARQANFNVQDSTRALEKEQDQRNAFTAEHPWVTGHKHRWILYGAYYATPLVASFLVLGAMIVASVWADIIFHKNTEIVTAVLLTLFTASVGSLFAAVTYEQAMQAQWLQVMPRMATSGRALATVATIALPTVGVWVSFYIYGLLPGLGTAGLLIAATTPALTLGALRHQGARGRGPGKSQWTRIAAQQARAVSSAAAYLEQALVRRALLADTGENLAGVPGLVEREPASTRTVGSKENVVFGVAGAAILGLGVILGRRQR